ncbi:uncharacterized protein [Miscanthus floridulus]|uniref:uncharacterized protein isoform X4 n=1 Tax=Miscanthus floridulus TaxID=154761 RepID=UPI0034581711
MQAQAGEARMQQQFLRPGRSRCGGGVPPIPRRQQSTSSRCSKPSLDASSSYGENFARSDHNNFQNQAVLSKRKRVHCVAPNQNDGFLEHRDELNKETCVMTVCFYPPQVKQQRNKRVIMEGLERL